MYAANERQLNYIKNLMAQRQLADVLAANFGRLVEQHDAELAEPGTGKLIRKQDASTMIDMLKEQPWKPREDERPDGNPAELGVYRRDGRIYVVREFTPEGSREKVRYARELVALTEGQANRLNGDGEHVRYEERKAPRMQHRLTDDDLMPLEDVKRLSIAYGHCIPCGAKLEAAESVERGIGPVCAKRQERRAMVSA
jgi:Family of unknown function (DUF6011)